MSFSSLVLTARSRFCCQTFKNFIRTLATKLAAKLAAWMKIHVGIVIVQELQQEWPVSILIDLSILAFLVLVTPELSRRIELQYSRLEFTARLGNASECMAK